ncbi:alkaline-phosphatase-like protein [Chytridium lagenaria]|nr:alkaline-phosphatase-like protein [Chytridium lagenaria]
MKVVTILIATLLAVPQPATLPPRFRHPCSIDSSEMIVPDLSTLEFLSTSGTSSDAEARTLSGTCKFTVSRLNWRDLAIPKSGTYEISLKAGKEEVKATWVVKGSSTRKAKNVVLFVGDGMASSMISAARYLAKKTRFGKFKNGDGFLSFETFPGIGKISTNGLDSIITDSANSAAAFHNGQKSSRSLRPLSVASVPVCALCVVTTAAVWDATPAAVFSYTRSRDDAGPIMEQNLNGFKNIKASAGGFVENTDEPINWSAPAVKADVILGGVLDQYSAYKSKGYAVVNDGDAMEAYTGTDPLLGIFHLSHLNTWYDRNVETNNLVSTSSPLGDGKAPAKQPGLKEMTMKAIEVMDKKCSDGWFLMSEAASVDKQMHPIDFDRGLADLLELDMAVQAVVDYDEKKETQIYVTSDHAQGYDVYGTVDLSYMRKASNDDSTLINGSANTNSTRPSNLKTEKRQAIGVYNEAGWPDSVIDDNGLPTLFNKQTYKLASGKIDSPNHVEDFEHKARPRSPTSSTQGTYVFADGTQRKYYVPSSSDTIASGGITMSPNLPQGQGSTVHTLQSVDLFCHGPASSACQGAHDNTELFFMMADALGLGDTADETYGNKDVCTAVPVKTVTVTVTAAATSTTAPKPDGDDKYGSGTASSSSAAKPTVIAGATPVSADYNKVPTTTALAAAKVTGANNVYVSSASSVTVSAGFFNRQMKVTTILIAATAFLAVTASAQQSFPLASVPLPVNTTDSVLSPVVPTSPSPPSTLHSEDDSVPDLSKLEFLVNGEDASKVLNAPKPHLSTYEATYLKSAEARDSKPGGDQTKYKVARLNWRDLAIPKSGTYDISLKVGKEEVKAQWVVKGSSTRKAKNVFKNGDGFFSFEKFPAMGKIATNGMDSIITDSANSAATFNNGQKSYNNALNVYFDTTPDNNFDDTASRYVHWCRHHRRCLGCTPAAVYSYTRSRDDAGPIIDQNLNGFKNIKPAAGGVFVNNTDEAIAWSAPAVKPIILGGGGNGFCNAGTHSGYTVVNDGDAMANYTGTDPLLGIFHLSHLNTGTTAPAKQPGLKEMTMKAIEVMDKKCSDGWFLMSEAASIDKQMHPIDFDRGLADLLELERTVQSVVDYDTKGDTQIYVTSDHAQGSNDDSALITGAANTNSTRPSNLKTEKRQAIGVYDDAGWPDSVMDADAGKIDSPNHVEDFEHKATPRSPTTTAQTYVFADGNTRQFAVPNPRDVTSSGGIVIAGNLPQGNAVTAHTLQVVLMMADALGLGDTPDEVEETKTCSAAATATATATATVTVTVTATYGVPTTTAGAKATGVYGEEEEKEAKTSAAKSSAAEYAKATGTTAGKVLIEAMCL